MTDEKVTDFQEIAVTEKPCGPSEHRLQYSYKFSCFFRPAGDFSSENYSRYVQPIAIVNSVEQFWNVYCHLVRPSDLKKRGEIHFFKKDINPTWEAEENKKGGKWIVRLQKGLCSRIWENLLLAMIGEQFLVGDEICGAVCSVRNAEAILSLWNKSADNPGVLNRLREVLGRVLCLPADTMIEYKCHDDCLKDQSNYRHANRNVYLYNEVI
ncbi:unnamed protein product, partial [Mesorhabditis belari]|uniref:eIF-4F 25 kDa subunit n=1 Tax=Mesorhabditis belari TaxID=2138241 RepID=A0AAF3E9H2_9BILA